jgi:pimeloyl-ACP methyl ester carboxylesterase
MPIDSPLMRPAPGLRRAYFDCRYGQLHVYEAIPAGGGFDEATAVICIPGAPGSGGYFQPVLAPLGLDRSVYAIDLPGHGLSDAPPAGAGAAEMAIALGDFLQNMRIRRVDLLAHGEGVAVALALARQSAALIGHLALSGDVATRGAGSQGAVLPTLNIEAGADFTDIAQRVRRFFDAN